MDLLAAVLGEDVVHIVGIEVVTADVAFEVEIVFCLCHNELRFMAQNYHLIFFFK